MPVVRMLLCLSSRRDTYVKSVLAEMLILCHQRDKNLPAWQMFLHSFSLFNEEVGEMSYSCLSRMTTMDPMKGDLDHVSKLYALVHEYAAIDDEVWGDTNRASMRSGSVKINPLSETAEAVRLFMRSLVDRLRNRTYMVYPVTKQQKGQRSHDQYRSFVQAQPYLVNSDTTPRPIFWRQHLKLEIDFHMLTVKKHMFGSFGHEVVTVWPEMVLGGQRDPVGNVEAIDFDGMADDDGPEEGADEKADESSDESLHGDPNEEVGIVLSDDSDEDDSILQRRFDDLIGDHRSKFRYLRPRTRVWTIDFEDATVSDTLKIYEGVVLPRTVRGRSRRNRGRATPAGYHRVQFGVAGADQIEDVVGTHDCKK